MTALHAVPDTIEVCDIADGVLDLDEQIALLQSKREMPFAYLWQTIGKPMFEAGKKSQVLDGIRYHVDAPREREYCLCCASLLYQCKTPLDERPGVFVRLDSRPSFWFRRVGGKESD